MFYQTHAFAARLRAGEGQNSAEKHHQSVERSQSTEGVPEVHEHALQTVHQKVRNAEYNSTLSNSHPQTLPALFNKHQ